MQHPPEPREDRAPLGVGFMLLAVSCFAGIDGSAKYLILGGLPALQVVFARYAGHFVVSLAAFLPAEGLDAFHSRAPWRQLARSVLLLLGTLLNFLALRYLPITVTTTIFFTVPIMVTLLSVPLLGERVGIRRVVAVLVGFAGVLVVIQPFGAEWHPAMLLSLASITCASLYFILTRRLSGVESNATSQLWTSGLATLAIAPLAFPVWVWPEGAVQWAVFLAIGGFGAAGHIFAVTAHRFALASTLSPVIYLQLIAATLVGVIVFNERPSQWTALGAAIIIGSGIYIWRRETAKTTV